MKRSLIRLSIGLAVALQAGCAKEPVPVPAAGSVTYHGKPLVGASLTFLPEDAPLYKGQSVEAYAKTDAQGRFELVTFGNSPGALTGTYKVTVSKVEVRIPPNFKPKDQLEAQSAVYRFETQLVPATYTNANTTPLRVTIPASGDTDIRLTLDETKKQ